MKHLLNKYKKFNLIKSKTICIFGDSISWGAWDLTNSGWADLLRKDFTNISRQIFTYNCSIAGETSTHLLNRLQHELEFYQTELAVFAIGINDAAFKIGGQTLTSLSEFKSNIYEMINTSSRNNCECMFLGLTPINEALTMPVPWNSGIFYSSQKVKEFDSIIEDCCNSNSIHYVKLFNIIKPDDLADGVHPNTSGHIKIFEELKKSLM